MSDCCSLSKRLADTVEVLTAPELPRDFSGAKTAVRAHKDQKTAVLDSLHIDQLVEEGKKLQQRMKSPSDSLKDNTDFIESTSLVGRLLTRVLSVGERLSQLWQTKDAKLQTNLELREYEYKCQQVCILYHNAGIISKCRSVTGLHFTLKNTLRLMMVWGKQKKLLIVF